MPRETPTPVCKFATKKLPDPRYEYHGQQQLDLLQAALPFFLGLGIGLGEHVAVGVVGGEGIDIVFGVGKRGGVEVDEGLVWGGHGDGSEG